MSAVLSPEQEAAAREVAQLELRIEVQERKISELVKHLTVLQRQHVILTVQRTLKVQLLVELKPEQRDAWFGIVCEVRQAEQEASC